MTKKTLSTKNRSSILRLGGFRARMATLAGRSIINRRRKKKRKNLTLLN